MNWILAAFAAQAVVQRQPVDLTCFGQGGTAAIEQVDIRLFGGDDRIRLPRTMLPMMKGGSGGWLKLRNVIATERAINAKAAINIANNPHVYLDRINGTITISGKRSQFFGRCQVTDPNAGPKF